MGSWWLGTIGISISRKGLQVFRTEVLDLFARCGIHAPWCRLSELRWHPRNTFLVETEMRWGAMRA